MARGNERTCARWGLYSKWLVLFELKHGNVMHSETQDFAKQF